MIDIYTPHEVTLVTPRGGRMYVAILRGVMLQADTGRSVLKQGDQEESLTSLYIPFSVDAKNLQGQTVTFLPPKEWMRCPDPDAHWTLMPEGESAGRGTWFVRGAMDAAMPLAEARELLDYLYVVAGYSLRDYGSEGMRHWEVKSRVASRQYSYGS